LTVAALKDLRARAAEGPETGQLRLTFTEKSPNSQPDVIGRRDPFANQYYSRGGTDYDLSAAPFQVFVPPKYSPSVPHGLFVFMSPGGPKVMPTWLPVFARHKLIFVGVPNTGKEAYWHLHVSRLALDAVHNLGRRYNIDPDRIYISGFSGGGMAASELIHAFPEVFAGCFCMNGENFYDARGGEEGVLEPGVRETSPWRGDYEDIKKRVAIVLLTGRRDAVVDPEVSISNARGLTLDGFTRTTLLVLPEGTHRHPDATWFERGIKALAAKPGVAPTTRPTTQSNPGPDQAAQARRYLVTAQEFIDGEHARRFRPRAAQCLETVLRDYPTTPAAPVARELLDWMEKHIEPPAPAR
jgi:predicted esterase